MRDVAVLLPSHLGVDQQLVIGGVHPHEVRLGLTVR